MNRFLSLMLVLFLLAACGRNATQPASPEGTQPAGLEISSPAFQQGGVIPSKYTCQGDDVSPALAWSDLPAKTQSLALVVDDPDAPVGTWVHWVVYNIPPDAGGLAEGASRANGTENNLPPGTIQGPSSFQRSDWGGPCPPSGTHRYFFRLYALDFTLNRQGLDKAALLKAIDGHVMGTGELMGTYQKQ